MNEIKIFENTEFGKVRTVGVDGGIVFVAKDVVGALGYTWNGSRIAHVPEEWRGMTFIVTPSGVQEMSLNSKHGSKEAAEEWARERGPEIMKHAPEVE